MKVEITRFDKSFSVACKIHPCTDDFILPLDGYDLTESSIARLESRFPKESKSIAETLKAMMIAADSKKEHGLPLDEELNIKQLAGEPKKYIAYFKDVSSIDEVDVYQVHRLFDIQDPSGCIHHASKKLLLSGVRTGGKGKIKDIEEARDTLNRYLEIHRAS